MNSRKYCILDAIKSIINQVDTIRIYFNPPYYKIPEELKNEKIEIYIGSDIGAAGKFLNIDNKDEIYFSIDDDLIYPQDYVQNTLKYLNKSNACSYHGIVFDKDKPAQQYLQLGNIKPIHFANRELLEVDIIGTGVGAVYTDSINCSINDFEFGNCTDIEWSALCLNAGLQKIVIPHEAEYVKRSMVIGYSIFDNVTMPANNYITELVNKKILGYKLKEQSWFSPYPMKHPGEKLKPINWNNVRTKRIQ